MSEPSKVLQLRYSHFEHSKIFKASKILVFNDLTFLLQDLVRAPQRRATLGRRKRVNGGSHEPLLHFLQGQGKLGSWRLLWLLMVLTAWNWGDLMISCSTMCHGCESSTPWNSHRSTNHSKNRERERRQQWIVIILICGRFIRTHHKGVFNGMDAFSKCQVVQPAKVWIRRKLVCCETNHPTCNIYTCRKFCATKIQSLCIHSDDNNQLTHYLFPQWWKKSSDDPRWKTSHLLNPWKQPRTRKERGSVLKCFRAVDWFNVHIIFAMFFYGHWG